MLKSNILDNKVNRKIVVVNQAINYLTIGILNEFEKKCSHVAVITGSVHVQGEELSENVEVTKINKFSEEKLTKKFLNWIKAVFKITYLLITKYRKYEVFFIPNPPIAYLVALFLPNRFSILMWDVYPDMLKIFGLKENNPVYKIWSWWNRRLFKKAHRVYTIGHNISKLVGQYAEQEKVKISYLWTTFSDFQPISKEENLFLKEQKIKDKFIVQYSGNIGVTHNVEVLLDVAELLKDREDILFQIIGRGNRTIAVGERIKESKLPNCVLLPFQSDEMFPHSLSAADVGVVILDDKTAQGSVPSKTYNLMTAAKPIIYIASAESELKDYAEKFKNGVCIHSSKVQEIADFVLKVADNIDYYKKLSENSLEASSHFNRENAAKLVEDYLK